MQLRVPEVARMFQVPEATVHSWIREGDLPAHLMDSHYRFQPAELAEWATLHHREVPRELWKNANGWLEDDGLVSALERGGDCRVAGTDTPAVYESLVGQIPGLCASERTMLQQLLLSRESAGSTAVGDGIAIPHPGLPVVLAHEHSLVMVGYLDKPLDFSASDGRPVDTLFLLITTSVRSHLRLLAELSSALRSQEFRNAVRQRSPVTTLLSHARRLVPGEAN